VASKIQEMREQLKNDLAVVGVPVLDDWLVRAEPPCILLTSPLSNSYVLGGAEFGSYVLNLDVVVLVKAGPTAEAGPTNESRDELEALIEDVLRNTVDWGLNGVDSPGTASLSDSTVEFLGTVVHLGKRLFL
jgi:hypothetical protein